MQNGVSFLTFERCKFVNKNISNKLFQLLGLLRDDRHQRQQPEPGGRHQGEAGQLGPGQHGDRQTEENHRKTNGRVTRYFNPNFKCNVPSINNNLRINFPNFVILLLFY